MSIFKSLRAKLIATFLVLGFGPLLLLSLLALQAINSTHRQDVASLEEQTINQEQANVQKFISDLAGQFEIRVGYSQTSVIANNDQEFLLGKLIDENPDILEVGFVNLLGVQTSVASRISTASLTPLSDLSLLPEFEAAKTGQTYYGPVEQTLSGPVMTLAGPVINADNQVVMVIIGTINLGELQRLLGVATLGNTGYIYLTNSEGTVIASANQNLVDKNFSHDPYVTNILAGDRHTGLSAQDQRLDYSGQEVLSAGQRINSLNWALIAEWPKDDAFAIVNGIKDQVIWFSLITALIIMFLAWLVGRSILNPIAELRFVATNIGQGLLDTKTNIKTGDELQELGEIINKSEIGLKRLEELREEFVFVAAHELRTPVTAIKGYLSMIQQGDAGEVSSEARELISKVLNANQRLIQLVEDLLQVARTEAGRLTIAIAPVALAPLIEQVFSELTPLARDKRINLKYSDLNSSQPVLADGDRVKEILINLIGNAIKYTTAAKGQVSVSHEALAGMLVTSVTDNGIGITEAEQAKLFEKFYRVKNADTVNISGTGLGLFIVKQLVEKMGGKIWVSSNKGQGSTFSFSLALANSGGQSSSATPPKKP